jgi:hypothetical protein
MPTWKLNPTKDPVFFLLIGPYNEAFVADLKREIPPPYREWKPVAKAWKIADAYKRQAQAVIDRHTRLKEGNG